MSQNLKWYFETTKNTFSGANDPIHETFRARPYYSIVRESIQNSMDVQLDKSKPVLVKFEIISINQAEHPELFSIRDHIESCLAFHEKNEQAKELYGGMLKYLDENPSVKILKVSDYNTLGMKYDPEDHLCPFTSFMGEGISSKSSGSGGSFGFGKGAYYVPSELRTILVSTMIDENKVFFQGRTRLASHNIDGQTKGKDGVFKIDEDSPITDNNEIARIFRRSEQGTDVYIIGMSDDPNCGQEMVKSVLNNFWLAVHENRLDVEIKTDDVNIALDEKNLEKIIDEYFPDETETGRISEIFEWNPRAYYKSVKYAEQSDDFLLIHGKLDILGPVRMYIYRKDGLQNRISFMRKPAMTVFKRGRSILSGYAATFVCDNEIGNEILRQMENAAHNEWEPANVRYVRNEEKQKYYNAKVELNDFVRETLKNISGVDNSSKLEITGLSDFLTIPEELLDEDKIISGNAESILGNSIAENETHYETGALTTKKTTIKAKVTNAKLSTVSVIAEEGDGTETINVGGITNDDKGGNMHGMGGINHLSEGLFSNTGNSKSIISIRSRVATSRDDKGYLYNLILNSDKNYSNVELVLQSGSDNGEFLKLAITESNLGIVDGNLISDLSLIKGKNIVKIRFEDNIKHALKISAYETR